MARKAGKGSRDTEPTKRPRRPKPFAVGEVRVRVIRGPKPGADDHWYFRAEVYDNATTRTVWTGWNTLVGATRAVAEIVAAGVPAGEPAPRATITEIKTVRDLLEHWAGAMVERQDITATTKKLNKRSAGHAARVIGEIVLSRLSMSVLEVHRDTRLGEGAAPVCVFEELKVVRRAYAWAQDRGYIEDQRRLPMPKLNVRGTRPKVTPSHEQFWKIVDALRQPWQRTVATLMAGTGCRIDEIASLTWERIDLDRKVIRIDHGKTPREILLAPATVELLRDLRPEVARGRILPVTRQTVISGFNDALRELDWAALGMPHFSSHAIRRLVIDIYYAGGADIGVVAAQLGQSPQVALKYYRQATAEQRARAVALAGLGERAEAKVVSLEERRRGAAGAAGGK